MSLAVAEALLLREDYDALWRSARSGETVLAKIMFVPDKVMKREDSTPERSWRHFNLGVRRGLTQSPHSVYTEALEAI